MISCIPDSSVCVPHLASNLPRTFWTMDRKAKQNKWACYRRFWEGGKDRQGIIGSCLDRQAPRSIYKSHLCPSLSATIPTKPTYFPSLHTHLVIPEPARRMVWRWDQDGVTFLNITCHLPPQFVGKALIPLSGMGALDWTCDSQTLSPVSKCVKKEWCRKFY